MTNFCLLRLNLILHIRMARLVLTVLAGLLMARAEAFAPATLLSLDARAGSAPSSFSVPRRQTGAGTARGLAMQQQRPSGAQRAAAPAAVGALASLAPVLAIVLPAVAGAEPPEWLEDTRSSLDIGLAVFSLFFFLRIPLTWYPQMDLKKFPQAVVAVPTEPFCALVRKVTPPLFGVDISPVRQTRVHMRPSGCMHAVGACTVLGGATTLTLATPRMCSTAPSPPCVAELWLLLAADRAV